MAKKETYIPGEEIKLFLELKCPFYNEGGLCLYEEGEEIGVMNFCPFALGGDSDDCSRKTIVMKEFKQHFRNYFNS